MAPARFGFQVLLVLALVALVSWPDHRQLRAGAFWQGSRPAEDRSGTAGAPPAGTRGQQYQIGYGSASEAMLGSGGAAALHRTLLQQDLEGSRRRLPAVVRVLGGRLNAIVGSARTSVNAAIPFARIVLRSLTSGAIEARAITDDDGRFTFVDVIPGVYLVELEDDDGRVIAASGPVVIGVNDVREAIVRLSGRRAMAPFGRTLAPTAHETIGAAADNGVNRIVAPERCASPPCFSAAQ